MSALEFRFRGLEVGYFEGQTYPKVAGCFHYEPYRGPGHYEMMGALKEAGEALIEFDDAGVQWTAVAKKSVYGVLVLAGFSSSSADAPKENA